MTELILMTDDKNSIIINYHEVDGMRISKNTSVKYRARRCCPNCCSLNIYKRRTGYLCCVCKYEFKTPSVKEFVAKNMPFPRNLAEIMSNKAHKAV
jgi:hypothetical protein